MGSPAAQAPAHGATRLSGRCELDPISSWVVDLLHDIHAGRPASWPTHSRGMQALLTSDRLHRGRADAPSAALALQETLSRRQAGQADVPRSVIQVHNELDGLISAAQGVICTYGWFLEPSSAAFICTGPGEAAAIKALLRRDYDLERGEDLLESAQWVAEELMAPSPGWRHLGPGPILLADQVHPEARWREVFLSPGCRGLQADQLLSVVQAAQVGLHVLRFNKDPLDS